MKRRLIKAAALLLLTAGAGARAGAQTTRGIENPAALDSFVTALAESKLGQRQRPVRILQIGDSHTAADFLTGAIRRRFQKDFGRPGALGGVTLEKYGVDGARALSLMTMGVSELRQVIGEPAPDMIVLAYGTNECTERRITKESYKALYTSIIVKVRSVAPGAAILIYGPPDRGLQTEGGWTTAPKLPQLVEAQREAAFENNAAFWSSYGAMGGAGSMNAWVAYGLGQGDHAHLTAAGYARIGNALYNDFVQYFNQYNPYERLASRPRDSGGAQRGRNLTRSVSLF